MGGLLGIGKAVETRSGAACPFIFRLTRTALLPRTWRCPGPMGLAKKVLGAGLRK